MLSTFPIRHKTANNPTHCIRFPGRLFVTILFFLLTPKATYGTDNVSITHPSSSSFTVAFSGVKTISKRFRSLRYYADIRSADTRNSTSPVGFQSPRPLHQRLLEYRLQRHLEQLLSQHQPSLSSETFQSLKT